MWSVYIDDYLKQLWRNQFDFKVAKEAHTTEFTITSESLIPKEIEQDIFDCILGEIYGYEKQYMFRVSKETPKYQFLYTYQLYFDNDSPCGYSNPETESYTHPTIIQEPQYGRVEGYQVYKLFKEQWLQQFTQIEKIR